MTRGTIDNRPETMRLGRVIGEYGDATRGPTLLCIAGMHGNEPSGVHALRRVFAALGEHEPTCHGRLIGLAGNVAALTTGARFIDRDLNRIWGEEDVAAARSGAGGANSTDGAKGANGANGGVGADGVAVPGCDSESNEQRELLARLDPLLGDSGSDVYFLDLHTTSADGAPFALMGDTLRNRAFSGHFPVPVILGLEEQLSGTITEYVNERGAVTVGFEAGRHDDPVSIDRHEAAVWLGLAGAGVLTPKSMPHVARASRLLDESADGLARIMEVRYRHAVRPDDGFTMRPGYRTFQHVRMGEILGEDRQGPVAAPVSGQILLPLYQRQGSDGFFIARPVRRMWLTLSALLRRLRADHCLPMLPGIVRDRAHSGVLLANPRIARFLTNEVFHLFGFRRCTLQGGRRVYRRRTHDFDGR